MLSKIGYNAYMTATLEVWRRRMTALQREWLAVLGVNLLLLAGGFELLQTAWTGPQRWWWVGLAGLLLAYQLAHLRRHLGQNHPAGTPQALYPDLGLGNWITLVRAVLLALLTGFWLLPRPAGWTVWIPGSLYMAAAVLDFMDGWAARATRHASLLGETLDMHWDGYGALVACALLVQYGQAPAWYLLVGLARYLFLLGLWLRKRNGQAIYEMQPSVMRRALAGAQMGFIAVILLPVFSPPATWVASTVFMLPLMGSFLRDWLVVSGVVVWRTGKTGGRAGWRDAVANLRAWLPLFFRGLTVVLLLGMLWNQVQADRVDTGLALAAAVGLLLIGAGAAGRLAALGVMLMCGFVLRHDAQNWLYWAALLAGTGVMLAGTGRYSLWKPEEWLIYHRPGESRQPN